MAINVLEYLEESVRKYPDKTAVSDLENSLSYLELSELSKKYGNFIKNYIKTGEPVLIGLPKSCTSLCLLLGTVMAGGFYVFVDMSQPLERINEIIGELDGRIIILDKSQLKKAEGLKNGVSVAVIEDGIINCDVACADNGRTLEDIRANHVDTDPLYAIFTSGSTGKPKGIVVNHRSVIDFIRQFVDVFKIDENAVFGNQAPFDFDVSVKDIYSCLKCGGTLRLIPKQLFMTPARLLDYLEAGEVNTLIWAVSALTTITALNGLSYKVPPKIKRIIFSGEIMPLNHLTKWQQAYPDALFVNVYGPTEITCNCTYYVIEKCFNKDRLPIGKPFKNERVFLLDEEDKLIDSSVAGSEGEICVQGTAVTCGYINELDKSRSFVQNPLNKHFRDIIYRTGDIGYYDETGNLVFLYRKDNQIKHNGHRIELEEIERTAMSLEYVSLCACTYNAGKIYAFYTGEAEEKDVQLQLRKSLPKFMVPHVILKVEVMPLTKNGKIDRRALAQMPGEV